MKIFTQVNRSQGMIRTLVGLRSRITSTKPVLTMVILLMVGSGNAWGGSHGNITFNAYAEASPNTNTQKGGYVTVQTSTGSYSYTTYTASSSQTKESSWSWGSYQQTSATFYYYASANTSAGYVFKGWSTSASDNTGTTSNPLTKTYYGTGTWGGTTYSGTTKYYAIFAKLTSASSLSLSDRYVEAGWGGEKSITVTYVHAGTVTAAISGTNKDDFSFSNSSKSHSTTVVSNNTNTEDSKSITIYFNPAAEGTRTATLTFSGNNMTQTVSLSGRGVKNPQTITWATGVDYPTSIVEENTLDIAGYASSNIFNTGIYYTTGNSSAISIDGTTLTAVKGQAGATVEITAHHDGNYKYAAATEKKTFSVTNKLRPEFVLYINNVAQEGTSANLKVGDVVEIRCTDVPNLQTSGGSATTFTYSAPTNTNSSKTVTVTATGATTGATLTLSQGGTKLIAERSVTFAFNISKHTTELSSLLNVENFYVGNSVYTGTSYNFANGTAYNTNNSEVTVDFSSTNENVINVVNGQIKALAAGTATVTISQTANNKWTGASVSQEITVKKHEPTFTWNVNSSYNWNKSISNPFSTNNNVTTITCSSNNKNVADYVDGKVVIYNVDGTAKFTLSQEGNDVWGAKSQDYTVTVSKASNHVTFTHGSSLSATKGNYTGVIEFLGVPSQVSCNLSDDASAEAYFYVWEAPSASGQFTRIDNSHTNGSSLTESLKPGTRAIKFQFDGDGWMRSDRTGTFSNITVSERRGVSAVTADVDCGTANNGSDATTGTAYLNWYNVKPLTCSLGGAHPEAFELVTTSIASKLDDYAENVPVTVRGRHDVAPGTYKATLNVTNGTESTSFNLTTTTTRQTPVINWKANLSPLSVGDVVSDAASAGSATVKYTVDGTYLTLNEQGAIVAENATDENGVDLIAYVEQDNTWEAASETIKVVVTNLEKQTITWNDKLSFKFTGNKVIDLTATSSSGLGITYELSGTGSYATLDNANKKLTVTGIGNTLFLTAKTVDHADYYPAASTKNINSRDPNASCSSYVLAEDYSETGLYTIDWKEITWDAKDGEPGSISFKIKRGIAAAGDMALDEWYDNDWHRIQSYGVSLDYANKTETISRKATKVRIGAPVGCTLWHYVDDVVLYQAKYCEVSETGLDFGTVTMGTAPTMSFTVHYSNLAKSLDIELENENTQFSVAKTYIGDDCGEHGTVTVTVTYNAANYVESESTNLVISNTEYTKKVSLKAQVQKASQTITWEPALTLNTTDDVTFDATTIDAAAETGIVVTYAVKGTSDVATVTTDGKLSILKDGQVTIVASAAGNNQYADATPVEKTFTISKVTPTITKNPTINSITLPATLANVAIGTDGTAEDDKNTVVTGSFTWQNSGTKVLAGANNYAITFTPNQPAGKDWYNSNTYNISVTGVKDSQEITWTRSNETTQPCSTPTTFDASSNRGLTISYSSSDASIAYVEKMEEEYHLVVVTGGTVDITASQAGNGDYEAAESVTKRITLTKETPVIVTPPTAEDIFTDNHLSEAALSGGEGQVNGVHAEGIFSWKNGSIQPEAGTHTYTATFTPSPAAWYYPAECQVSVKVSKHPHQVSWDYAGGTIYVDKNDLYFSGAESDAQLEVYYTTSNASIAEVDASDNNKLIIHGKGVIDIIARSEGNNNYEAAQTTAKLTIKPLTVTVDEAPTAEDITYGDALSESHLTGGTVKGSDDATLQGTWTWNNGAEQLAAGQNQSRGVTFTPTLSNWYECATTNTTVNVAKADITLGWTANPASVVYGNTATYAASSVSNGTVTYSIIQEGDYASIDANGMLTVNEAGHTVTVQASQAEGTNYNASETITTTVTLSKAETTLAWTANPASVVYGNTATYTASSESNGAITYSITEGSEYAEIDANGVLTVNEAGHEVTVQASQADGTNYVTPEVLMTTVTLNQATPEGYSATTSAIEEGHEVSESTITNTGIAGSWEWKTPSATYSMAGTYDVAAIFTPEDTNYKSVEAALTLTVNVPKNVFIGTDGDWENPANWTNGVPTGDAPDVVVSGELVIDDEVTVGSLTIQPTGGVTIVDDGKLTVTGESEIIPEYGDIHVMDDGALELESTAVLEVRHFMLDAKLGGLNALDEKESAASGQVDGTDKLNVSGDVYFQMSFDPMGKISFGWYDFVVPFRVNVTTGIFREGDLEHHLVSGVDFLIQEYSEAKNANNQRAWSNFTGTLQPGRVYTITFNYDPNFDQNTFLFKNADGTLIENTAAFTTQYTNGNGSTDVKGWNGLGNGMLRHGYITGTYAKMQVYNHAENKYDLLSGNKTFAVGTSFFVQVDENTPSMIWNVAEASEERPLYAPKREANEVEEFLLSLRKEDKSYVSDNLYFSASEDATDAYVIGHDLLKMGSVADSKSAQMWSTKGGKNLCDVEATLNGSTATTPLSIYAPSAGNYELNVEEAPENTMLYLTYNGRAIWNLTYSPYVFDLTKGTTEGYGLKMYVMQVATDVETVTGERLEVNGNRKVLIDDVIYIVTPEGKMYDITGKSANY